MAKVMWLGEDTEETPGPSFNTWCGVKFPKGVDVKVTDPHMLAKARTNQFYKVTEDEPKISRKEALQQFGGTDDMMEKQEVLPKQEAEQYDTSGARDVTPKQETQHAQGKALERKAQELKSKIENKKEDYDYRKAEKVSGYSAAKKRVTKDKAANRPGVSAPHARPDRTDTDAA